MYEYSLVSLSDCKKYGDILSKTEISGQLTLSFKRVPNFLDSLSRQFDYHETIKASYGKEMIGFATVSSQRLLINGLGTEVGHISNLLIDQRWRKKGVLKNAQPFLRLLIQKKQLDLFYITVMGNNRIAKDLISSGKSYLPKFYDLGEINTYIIQIRKYNRNSILDIAHPLKSELPLTVDFINTVSANKELSPVCEMKDDLKAENCYTAKLKGETVGAFFINNQSDFRRISVLNYNFVMKVYNFFNDVLSIFGFCKKMPTSGSIVPIVYIRHLAIKDNNPHILAQMLKSVSYDLRNSPYLYMVFGLHEADSLNKAIKGLTKISYKSRIFMTSWSGDKLVEKINKNNIYIDLSFL